MRVTDTSDEKYVPLDEAVKLLGINQGRFFYYVDAGPIAKEPGSGKRNARYSVEDILKVKERLSQRKPKPSKTAEKWFVDWIGEGDVLLSIQLDYRLYGPEAFSVDIYQYVERVKRNPHMALAAFEDARRFRMIAYIMLLPLPETTIMEVLSGKRRETDIKNSEIETYERKGEYTLLAESVVVDRDYRESLNTLLNHLTTYWCDQYPNRTISKIYAQAESDQGDILIQKLFFAPLENVAPNAYVLNLKRPGASRVVRNFQACIKEKQEAQETGTNRT